MIVLAGLWLERTAHVPESARTRAIAAYALAMPLVGLFIQRLEDSFGAYGVTRTVGVLVLAYGILKHDILGIDRKVRWGVSKTTLAGVFVAVFFVAGELAETYFGEVLGAYGGVLAAGVLIFFLAPLQRLADRVASTAVPHSGAAVSEADKERRRSLYRSTVERFLDDGSIGDQEAQELADLAEELDIGAGTARRIQQEVEGQRESGTS